jgi:hypothetical protein
MRDVVYALLPDGRGGVRVDTVHPRQDVVRAMPAVPFAPFGGTRAYADMPNPVVIDVQTFSRGERLSRRERRERARANGRRRAIAVPIETRWEVRAAIHPDVSSEWVRSFLTERAEVVERVWDRRARRCRR